MRERDDAITLANKVLDDARRDPDDDLAMLSRQFLRALEEVVRLQSFIHQNQPPAPYGAESK